MGWRMISEATPYTGFRQIYFICWVHDIQMGTTIRNYTCPDCGFTGSFIIFYNKEWYAPFGFPLFLRKDYYLGECPHCKVEIDINYREMCNPN
jgi:hypothetical protein